MSYIKNYAKLALTPQREHALKIIEEGLRACATDKVISQLVQLIDQQLKIGPDTYDLATFQNIYVISIGKAAIDAAATLETILGNRLTDGIVLDTRPGIFHRLKSIVGTHPLPSLANQTATQEITKLIDTATETDLIITVISGGGSALLIEPTIELSDLQSITAKLLNSGATIQEINTIRKHLSRVKGGQLAARSVPATLVSLIFSDVPGDNLAIIASGPTVLDQSTTQDAEEIISRYKIRKICHLPHLTPSETPKDPTLFNHVTNYLAVSNSTATTAMRQAAYHFGYSPSLLTTTLSGEAAKVGADIARQIKTKQALIAAGETTVTVTNSTGQGGRNLSVALGALTTLPNNALLISLASDGKDNVPVAGAIADNITRNTAKRLNLSITKYLRENNSYPFFQQTGGLIETNPTGINISDLILCLKLN